MVPGIILIIAGVLLKNNFSINTHVGVTAAPTLFDPKSEYLVKKKLVKKKVKYLVLCVINYY